MDDMNAQVVEIAGSQLRQLKQRLLQLTGVRSAAQQGLRLRVLVDRAKADPLQWIAEEANLNSADYTLELVRPSLEDVFVSSTGNV